MEIASSSGHCESNIYERCPQALDDLPFARCELIGRGTGGLRLGDSFCAFLQANVNISMALPWIVYNLKTGQEEPDQIGIRNLSISRYFGACCLAFTFFFFQH